MEHASNAYSERLLQTCEGLAASPLKKSIKTKDNARGTTTQLEIFDVEYAACGFLTPLAHKLGS
jgi:hypothetical protein